MAIARALLRNAPILLLDEATSALDEASTAVLEELAVQLAAGGTPVVWVTHDMGQMHRIADQVIRLDHGRLTYAGPPAGLPVSGHDGGSR